jgi:Txe/YoeB family toxin of Txe-Axe toxin-antitoxin module
LLKILHIKSECPNLTKAKGKSYRKPKGGWPKARRAYIAWDDEEEDSSSNDSDNEEIANLCLMAHIRKHKQHEVSDSDNQPSYDELQNAFNEMYGEALDTFRKLSRQKKMNAKLEEEIAKLKNDNMKITSAFESLKEEHALILNELNKSSKETMSINQDKECETCPTLQIQIKSLKLQLEEASNIPMEFAILPSKIRLDSKKSNKKKKFYKRRNNKNWKSKATILSCEIR